MATNPVRDQDRAEDLLDNWRKYGYVMFPQQRAIYSRLAARLDDKVVLEVGCGDGLGGAMLARRAVAYLGTDKLQRNAAFARCLYPWLDFDVWDVCSPHFYRGGFRPDAVVAVEVLEHVADPLLALWNILAVGASQVWLSTPNGRGKSRPPENPCHVREYTPQEVLDMVSTGARACTVEVFHWETFEPLGPDTDVDPLVYRIIPCTS